MIPRLQNIETKKNGERESEGNPSITREKPLERKKSKIVPTSFGQLGGAE